MGGTRHRRRLSGVGSGRHDGSEHGSGAMRLGDRGRASHCRSPGIARHDDMAIINPTDPLVGHAPYKWRRVRRKQRVPVGQFGISESSTICGMTH